MEIAEFVEKLQGWHDHKVAQLRQITEQKDAYIVVGKKTIDAGSELAKGIRFGVEISLELLGKLPFSVSHNDDDMEEEEL